MKLTRDQAIVDATRALSVAYPERWEAILDALLAPKEESSHYPAFTTGGPNVVVFAMRAAHFGGPLHDARSGLEIFSTLASPVVTTDNLFPYAWESHEIYGASDVQDPSSFVVVERVNGMEVARFPLGAMLGLHPFVREYDTDRHYSLTVERLLPGDCAPFFVAFTFAGFDTFRLRMAEEQRVAKRGLLKRKL